MSTTGAIPGYGSLFQLNDGSGTYTSIAEVVSIGAPGLSRKMIEATHLQSPSAAAETIAGIVEAGEVEIKLNFLPADATQTDLWASIQSQTDTGAEIDTDIVRTYRIKFSDGSNFVFNAGVSNIGPATPQNDRMTCDVKFKVTGLPAFSQT